MRWVGIDEAGYGPNLGPMVMTAVVAEGPDDRAPDVWGDLAATVARAGDCSQRLWIDDSKAILRAHAGRQRLEATCRAALAAARGSDPVDTLGELLSALGAGTLVDAELTPWIDDDPAHAAAATARSGNEAATPMAGPFAGVPWRLTGIHAVVVGPARFNAGLAATGSKAQVHFDAFARLLGPLWDRSVDGVTTHVRGDKHGGRHYYHAPLSDAFPEIWIDRGPEGPALSRYTLRAPGRRLELSLMPRADGSDGLVALASIVSKTVRERWMDCFNAYWTARIPGLRPTAGYPLDARRFRQVIEPACQARGLDPSVWWREK